MWQTIRSTWSRISRSRDQGPRAPAPRPSIAEIFTRIYEGNHWRGQESVSGTGSDLGQTRRLIDALPGLFRTHEVRSLLDVPCGDFHWMKHVDLTGIDYLGGDIVAELIARNQRHARPGIAFQRLDLLHDPLPAVDLILCRDCLVHFSFDNAFQALANICASGARYLLTTTFPSRWRNRDIATGRFRPLNLQRAPFLLPPPLRLLAEGCTEARGRYADKSLGLWAIADFRVQAARPGSCRP